MKKVVLDPKLGPREEVEEIAQQILTEGGLNQLYYAIAKRRFAKEDFVSTAKLQLYLRIPYFKARSILDWMIRDHFCEPQFGTWPCRVIKFIN